MVEAADVSGGRTHAAEGGFESGVCHNMYLCCLFVICKYIDTHDTYDVDYVLKENVFSLYALVYLCVYTYLYTYICSFCLFAHLAFILSLS